MAIIKTTRNLLCHLRPIADIINSVPDEMNPTREPFVLALSRVQNENKRENVNEAESYLKTIKGHIEDLERELKRCSAEITMLNKNSRRF